MSSVKVAEVLNGAADLIERDGWCQGTPPESGPVCAGVAITRAARRGAVRLTERAVFQLGEVIGQQWSVIPWNDAPGRTAAEVVGALRAAAERASGEVTTGA